MKYEIRSAKYEVSHPSPDFRAFGLPAFGLPVSKTSGLLSPVSRLSTPDFRLSKLSFQIFLAISPLPSTFAAPKSSFLAKAGTLAIELGV